MSNSICACILPQTCLKFPEMACEELEDIHAVILRGTGHFVIFDWHFQGSDWCRKMGRYPQLPANLPKSPHHDQPPAKCKNLGGILKDLQLCFSL